MKKTIKFLTVLVLVAASFTFTSCSSDDDNDLHTQLEDGKYKVTMDGSIVAEGTTEEVGMVGNSISLSVGNDFGVLISEVPETVGVEVKIGENNSETTVIISGKNLMKTGTDEMYFSISGTVKRTSESKIYFEGTCSEMGGTTVHTFSGTAESVAFKVI
ncbi:hypothetical protein [Lutibacter citreus]|uniref:hypothetical protein n=1 Tax=Lutibacter citreus TaxID=2138210 RepID=UPI000DBE4CCB|nr:hypothetical protein [Lutibacter citreus]